MESFDRISPLYTVYYYTDFLYKVVKFKRSGSGVVLRYSLKEESAPSEEPSKRFDSSYSRSRRMVLQYALCNSWEYFITITVSPERFDRYDLKTVYNVLYAFFKFYRSALSPSFRFLLVPEMHEDGAWHFHGFVSGVLPCHLSKFIPGLHPQKLINAGYLNWGMLGETIGFVSLSKVKNSSAAAFYVVKYITKQHANDSFYEHLYYCSRGLSTARPVADFYSDDLVLDQCLTYDDKFCSCGWFRLSSGDFTFPYSLSGCEIRDHEQLLPLDELGLEVTPLPAPEEVEEFIQLSLSDWLMS